MPVEVKAQISRKLLDAVKVARILDRYAQRGVERANVSFRNARRPRRLRVAALGMGGPWHIGNYFQSILRTRLSDSVCQGIPGQAIRATLGVSNVVLSYGPAYRCRWSSHQWGHFVGALRITVRNRRPLVWVPPWWLETRQWTLSTASFEP